jgi:tetratricopeptide (TPR) repeat protein
MYIRRGYLDQGIEMLSELAELQRAQGQIKDAVESLEKAADVHWMLGRHDQCYAFYDRILQFAPNDIEARTQLSNFFILSGRSRDAFNEQKKIAQICVQQRNYEEAISAFHGAISLVQDDTETYEQFGEVLMRVKEYAQAIRIYKRLHKLVQGEERERVEAMIGAAQRMLDQQNDKS